MKLYTSKILIISFLILNVVYGSKPFRVGTTTANFLEIGYGSAGNAMGDATVASVNDLSAIYWNPARLAFLQQHEAQFMYQPWFADINTAFTAIGLVSPSLGTFAIGFIHVGYGDMEVTTMEMQDGTGEMFSANEYCIDFVYARRLVNWFTFGAGVKYIASQIWHCNANALALDLGVVVNTQFLSTTGKRDDGISIGMSIANYGTKMKYDGMDLLQPIDAYPDEQGNYKYAEGQYRTSAWELPLIFRIGAAFYPVVSARQRLTVEIDALHPNNNSESVNIGAQYQYNLPTFGSFFLRGGYKALFMEDSEYGLSLGGGILSRMMDNLALRIDYAFRDIGILGKTHSYTVSFLF
jgi:hypothetical protein